MRLVCHSLTYTVSPWLDKWLKYQTSLSKPRQLFGSKHGSLTQKQVVQFVKQNGIQLPVVFNRYGSGPYDGYECHVTDGESKTTIITSEVISTIQDWSVSRELLKAEIVMSPNH